MGETRDQGLDALIGAIPEGWSRTRIAGQTWGVTRTTRAGGKVISIDAERLGAAEGLGANVWFTADGAVLRPCEVSEERVMQFLRAAVSPQANARTEPAVQDESTFQDESTQPEGPYLPIPECGLGASTPLSDQGPDRLMTRGPSSLR